MSENNNYPEGYNELDEMYNEFKKVYDNIMNNVSDGLYALKGRTNRQLEELYDFVDNQHYTLKNSRLYSNEFMKYIIKGRKVENENYNFEGKKELVLDQVIITKAENTFLNKNSNEKLFSDDENRRKAKKLLLDIRPKLKDEFDKESGRPVKHKKKEMSYKDINNQTQAIKEIIKVLDSSWTEVNLSDEYHNSSFIYTGKSNKELIIHVLENEAIRLKNSMQSETETQDNEREVLISNKNKSFSTKQYLDAWTKTKNFVKKIKPDMLSIQNRFNRHKGYNSLKS